MLLLLRGVPASLGRLPSLRILQLADNRIQYLPCELARLRLKKLVLTGNRRTLLRMGATSEEMSARRCLASLSRLYYACFAFQATLCVNTVATSISGMGLTFPPCKKSVEMDFSDV